MVRFKLIKHFMKKFCYLFHNVDIDKVIISVHKKLSPKKQKCFNNVLLKHNIPKTHNKISCVFCHITVKLYEIFKLTYILRIHYSSCWVNSQLVKLIDKPFRIVFLTITRSGRILGKELLLICGSS